MKHLITFFSAAALTLCGLAEEDKPCCCAAAKDAIVATVKLYIAAGEKGDSKIAKQAFAPGATMSWSENGTATTVPIQALYDYFDKSGPQTVTYENLNVTALSQTTATVSIDTCFGTTKFKDMFALVRAGDKWQIVAKTYHVK